MKPALLLGLIVVLTIWSSGCDVSTEDPMGTNPGTVQATDGNNNSTPATVHAIDPNLEQKTDSGLPIIKMQTAGSVQQNLNGTCNSANEECDDPLTQLKEPDPHPWDNVDE